MKLRDWPSLFAKKEPPSLKAPSPVRLARSDMTIERWQKDDGLVTWARTSQEFAAILSITHNQQPSGFPVRGQPVTDIQCAVELGRKEGYADCENVLLALRQLPVKRSDDVPADYDATEYSQASEG